VALYISRIQLHTAQKRTQAERDRQVATWATALDALSQRVDSLASEVRELGEQGSSVRPAGLAPGVRNAMNLTKRAQALRMYRRGDPPEQIAALLDVPSQEIELLLKVHRIIMTNI